MTLNNELELRELLKEDIVVLDFFAPWCNPCKMLSPIIDTLDSEMEDVKFVKVNIDEFPEIAVDYGVVNIPTLKIIKKGEVVDTINGFIPKPMIEAKINPHK